MAKPLGLTLPVELGQSGYFRVTANVLEQVTSNLTNLLLTKIGERPLSPTFGSDLHKVIFEAQTDNGLAEVQGVIASAVKKWMPFVTINDVQVQRFPDTNRIIAKIFFSVQISGGIVGTVNLEF